MFRERPGSRITQGNKPGCRVLLCLLAVLLTPLATDAEETGGGVTGTVSVFRTRVQTAGTKSDREVVVYLERADGREPPPVTGVVTMDQKGLVFIPHVLPVQVGTTVEFLNNDTVEHNVYFLSERARENLDLGTWPQGVSVRHTFSAPDVFIILCKLHLEMAAYVVALPTPYFTTAFFDEESQTAHFALEGVPAGRYLLKAWHKKLLLRDPPLPVTIAAGKEVQADLVITKRKYVQESPPNG